MGREGRRKDGQKLNEAELRADEGPATENILETRKPRAGDGHTIFRDWHYRKGLNRERDRWTMSVYLEKGRNTF